MFSKEIYFIFILSFFILFVNVVSTGLLAKKELNNSSELLAIIEEDNNGIISQKEILEQVWEKNGFFADFFFFAEFLFCFTMVFNIILTVARGVFSRYDINFIKFFVDDYIFPSIGLIMYALPLIKFLIEYIFHEKTFYNLVKDRDPNIKFGTIIMFFSKKTVLCSLVPVAFALFQLFYFKQRFGSQN